LTIGVELPVIKIFIVSDLTASFDHLVTAIRGSLKLKLVGQSASFLSARPKRGMQNADVILINLNLSGDRAFEAATTLLSHSGKRWLTFDDSIQPSSCEFSLSNRSNLFSLPVNASPKYIEHHIMTLCHAKQTNHLRDSGFKPAMPRKNWARPVFIGSSTGGISALMSILKVYPEDCPPTVIVQHTGTQFIPSLVNLLNSKTKAIVAMATPGTRLQNGHVYLAGSTRHHLTIHQRSTHLISEFTEPNPSDLHAPSIDKLFTSAAKLKRKCVGVLLTGMGKDGSEGLGNMQRAGSQTIVQDEKTSTVYGMPRIAWEAGAANLKLPIDKIGGQILEAAATNPQHTHLERSLR